MPNWTNTNITFMGGHNDIMALEKMIRDVFDHGNLESDFGNGWLGNILALGGGDPYDVSESYGGNAIPCRGWIEDFTYDKNSDTLSVHQYSAWNPMIKVWTNLIIKKNLGLGLVYTAEDEGGWYAFNSDTTGEYYPEKFNISIPADDLDYNEYPESEQELLNIVKEFINADCKNANEAIKAIKDAGGWAIAYTKPDKAY